MSSPDGSEDRIASLEGRLKDARNADRQDHLRVLISLEKLTEWVERIADRQNEADREFASREGVIEEYRRWRTKVEADLDSLLESLARLDERYAQKDELEKMKGTEALTPLSVKLLSVAAALLSLAFVIALGGGDLLRELLK